MICSAVAALVLGGSAIPVEPAPNGLSHLEAGEGFKLLFDGSTLNGWIGWKKDHVPKNWAVEDGTLRVAPGGESGDIRTVEMYADFDLRLEWKVDKAANSGVIYRATEDHDSCWQTGPEYQIFDDFGGGNGRPNKHSAGSLYDVYAPPHQVSRSQGQWNESRIVLKGNHVEHWLNGVRLVSCELGSPDWNEHLAASKFKSMPDFAKNKSGYICLQDHGHKVWFRNLRVRRL